MKPFQIFYNFKRKNKPKMHHVFSHGPNFIFFKTTLYVGNYE